jgi:DNA polymerase-3 subunit epsilon
MQLCRALQLHNGETEMKLCGLDFETANSCSGSICAVGVAMLEDGVTVERREYLVKPHKSLDYMSRFCRDVHGISYGDLRESPEFPEIWHNIKRLLLSSDCVVIHNASFDLRHLHNALSLYKIPSVSFDYVCSLQLCRYHFPEFRSHGLADMAEKFGITFQHHDALEDAETCAKITSQLEIPENFISRFEYVADM